MNPPPLLPVHCNLLLFIPHPRGRRHPFQSTTLRTLKPDICKNVLQRQKKLKMILSNKEKSVCDVLFWYKMINLSTFASFEDEHFFRSPLCIAQRSRESGVLRGHLFPYFHFHPSSSICDISLAGSHRIFGIIL